MTKIVVNRCFGGFGLSPRAVKEIAKLKGKDCYFFILDMGKGLLSEHKKITLTELEKSLEENRITIWSAYSIKNPDFEKMSKRDEDGLYKTANAYSESISVKSDYYQKERADKVLVAVVKKLGNKANGSFADLEIVEVPDDSEWYIDEYDGQETVREGRTW